MTVRERVIGGVAVVDLAGRMTLTDSPGLLKDVVSRLVFCDRQQIVLNFADVNYIDSSGLGELVACYVTAVRAGGAIKLANAGPRVLDVLVLTRLVTIFEVHPSEQSAILSFAGAAV